MAGLFKRLEQVVASQTPTYYDGELYKPECHYMRGPGPAWRNKQRSLRHPQNGGSFPRIADSSGTAKVAPDTLGALLSPRK